MFTEREKKLIKALQFYKCTDSYGKHHVSSAFNDDQMSHDHKLKVDGGHVAYDILKELDLLEVEI
jgi:hypothetical protein